MKNNLKIIILIILTFLIFGLKCEKKEHFSCDNECQENKAENIYNQFPFYHLRNGFDRRYSRTAGLEQLSLEYWDTISKYEKDALTNMAKKGFDNINPMSVNRKRLIIDRNEVSYLELINLLDTENLFLDKFMCYSLHESINNTVSGWMLGFLAILPPILKKINVYLKKKGKRDQLNVMDIIHPKTIFIMKDRSHRIKMGLLEDTIFSAENFFSWFIPQLNVHKIPNSSKMISASQTFLGFMGENPKKPWKDTTYCILNEGMKEYW